ncbi:hypothetical protein [Arcicella rigui]|uniref:Uncharacterized protein n=1 Tax=Arcicella rigui TaxID=797020 RepID=A0ABU5QE99_9BACT|nr:hypothetical protein [Arcicella rigui]MEA5141180.1 hypothetical protein [Arcicella rigui]
MLTIVEHISGEDSEYLREKFIELYKNPYCTYEYYETYFNIDELKCLSIFEDDKLVHLLIIKIDYKDNVIYVLNRMIDLNTKYINFVSDYLLMKESIIKKIQFDHLLNPSLGKSNYPKYNKLLDEDYIIQLPNSCAEYLLLLSYHMRKQTKSYISKINRNIGQFSFNTYEKSDISDAMFYQLVDMKTLRMQKKKRFQL